jgi:hypothetical protein
MNQQLFPFYNLRQQEGVCISNIYNILYTQITIMRIFADPDFFPFWISDPGFLIQQQQQMSKEK